MFPDELSDSLSRPEDTSMPKIRRIPEIAVSTRRSNTTARNSIPIQQL